MSKKRKYSSSLVDGIDQAGARSMLRPTGFSDEDFKKPQVGIASTWSNVTPCNMHINELAQTICSSVVMQGSNQFFLIPSQSLMVFQWELLE